MRLCAASTVALGLLTVGSGALLPEPAKDLKTISSGLFPGFSISYKQASLRNSLIRWSPIITPYRTDTYIQNAPLSLWLQGGPGSPSVVAALGSNGPCIVLEDSKTTKLNEWSWNSGANMLYLDQPVQVGFSYDELVTGTVNETLSPFLVTKSNASVVGGDDLNALPGIFPSQKPSQTVNTTASSARAMWWFLQSWLQEFPEYSPPNKTLSIWGESYGGHYAPALASHIAAQNSLLRSSQSNMSKHAIPITVDALGLVNACIDNIVQTPLYPEFAFNNTYGIQAINETEYKAARAVVPECIRLSEKCRALGDELDPHEWGSVKEVNDACAAAFMFCFGSDKAASKMQPFQTKGRDLFDITQPKPNPFPPKFAAGYLNMRETQQDLGVPLNFTGFSAAVKTAFDSTGDFIRGKSLAELGQLLDAGTRVMLMYGDADYQCNWLGGEQISLAINSSVSAGFRAAGYTDLFTNSSYKGGVVREYGGLSFVRVFDAGHAAPYYQPETAHAIFTRTLARTDIATGQSNSFRASSGPSSSFGIKNAIPPPNKPLCYVWDVFETCSARETALLAAGRGVVRDFVLVGERTDNGTEILYGNGNVHGGGNNPSATISTSTPNNTETARAGAGRRVVGGLIGGLVAAVSSVVLLIWL
ncbi:uncharacterized protein JN550_003714 [Neoarthrinium moseri]|uniref:uncharacterized protein n=1 Tax=Neoarthrinium moseri TaxID=1658444 RepID=UPI001FDDE894|nr:uncharacterized protein JN550_003714 [Neoarthrinium moseri]KAI1872840.1 hypothetical protein JN550_003714 [Neoarthrinium moseri]